MERQQRRALSTLVALLVVIVLSVATVAPAIASSSEQPERGEGEVAIQQVRPANNTTNEDTPVNNTTNGTTGDGSLSSANRTEVGTNTGGGFGISVNPAQMFMDMLNGLVEAFLNIGAGAIEMLNTFIFNLPAPGEPAAPSTWTSPDSGMWSGVYGAMGYTVMLAVVVLGGAVGVSFLHTDERSRRNAWKRCAIAGGLVILGIAVPAIILHSVDAVIRGLAPSGDSFFQTPANFGKLGIGIGLGLAMSIFQTGTVAGAIVVLALERMLIYMTVYLWPLAWACYAYTGFVRSLGQTVIYTFGVVVAMKFVQALIVRLLFELPWWNGTLFTPLSSFAMTLGGLGFALILFPKAMMDHANDAASVSLGTSAAHQEGGQYIEESAKRAYESVHDKYESYRSEDAETADEDQVTVGQVSQGSTSTDISGSQDYHETTSTAPGSNVEGIDANDWSEQRAHIEYSDRGIQ